MIKDLMDESVYTEAVKRVKSMASDKYGHEILESSRPSGLPCWKFSQGTWDRVINDPLLWRLDTYANGVNVNCIFRLDDCTEEIIRAGFAGMDAAREYTEEKLAAKEEEEE